MVAELIPHNWNLIDFAVVAGAIAYVISLVKDWRPIKALRAENTQLRDAFADLQDKFAAQGEELKKALEKISLLEKSRDFSAPFESALEIIRSGHERMAMEHERILSDLAEHGAEERQAWSEMHRGLSANTAVLSTLAAGLTAAAMTPMPGFGEKLVEHREVGLQASEGSG